MADLRPRGLDFFTERLPVVAGRPSAPCSFLQLSEGYAPAARAGEQGWPVLRLDGGHFYMLREPKQVAHSIDQMITGMMID